MREGPDSLTLAHGVTWVPRVSSWLDGDVLAEDIPIVGGSVSWSRGSQVPDRVTLSVPAVDPHTGTVWDPGTDARAPLGRYGQALDVQVTTSDGDQEWSTRLGRFGIHHWESRGGMIEVEAYGPLYRATEDRFLAPEAPRAGGTLASEFLRLLPPGLGVSIDPALVDRPVPQGMTWESERIAALYEIADAWPAVLGSDGYGQVTLRPPVETLTPVLTLTDGYGGVVMDVQDSDTRDGAYNAVVASGTEDTATSAPVRAVAIQETGPMAWRDDGQGYGRVPRFFTSPLLGSESSAAEAARTMLAAAIRPSRMVRVTMPPDPRIELDDVLRAVRHARADGTPHRSWVGPVHTITLPLVVGSGPMSVDLAVG